MLIFEVFLHLKGPLVATFNKTCAIFSRKNVAEQGINILKISQKHINYFGRTSLFLLQNNSLKNAIFVVFYS